MQDYYLWRCITRKNDEQIVLDRPDASSGEGNRSYGAPDLFFFFNFVPACLNYSMIRSQQKYSLYHI